jgi:hypothetical protein
VPALGTQQSFFGHYFAECQEDLLQSKIMELLEDALARRNDNVICMGNQNIDANSGDNSPIQIKGTCSSYLRSVVTKWRLGRFPAGLLG